MVGLAVRTQDASEARLAGQVQALVGHAEHVRAFGRAQRMGGYRLRNTV